MHTDNIFRLCIIVSISLHLCLVLPWPFLNFLSKPETPFQKMEMTYFNEKEMPRPKSITLSEIKSGNTALAAKTADSHNISESAPAKKKEQEPVKEMTTKKEEKPVDSARPVDEKRENSEIIEIGTQKGVVYEKYYLDVREKIKAIIEKNKRGILNESEVCIRFIVDRNGTLKDLYLYKSSGREAGNLEKLAVKSIRAASPFPPFTDKIKENELQFNLPIRVIRRY